MTSQLNEKLVNGYVHEKRGCQWLRVEIHSNLGSWGRPAAPGRTASPAAACAHTGGEVGGAMGSGCTKVLAGAMGWASCMPDDFCGVNF